MELIFNVIKYMMFGFVGFIAALVLLAVLFGKRVVRKWEYEAEFRDASGREFGELDIEMSRIEKDEPDFSLKAKFSMRHPALSRHQTIQVFVDDLLLLQGMVAAAGRIRLNHREHLQNAVADVSAGQRCRVVAGGQTLFEELLVPD